MTSSVAAVLYGHERDGSKVYDESSWSIPEKTAGAYEKSKTLAERAAWEFMEREGGDLELSVVNPVAVFGPVLGDNYATSVLLVRRLMDGAMPGCPRLAFGVVDVRDVVDLHLRAMTDPAAAGGRFLAISGDAMTIHEMAEALRTRLGEAARRVPTRQLPDFVVRLVGLFDRQVSSIVPELGRVKNATSAKAQRVLGWAPRTREEALFTSAESLMKLGLLETQAGSQ
jgi:dihydroflavonol-4-reductase